MDSEKKYSLENGDPDSLLKEPAVSYATKESEKQQGEYTLEDYFNLPEERRVELIDGVFYDMSAPLGRHQIIIGQLHAILLSHMKELGKGCMPFISPIDVRLDSDDRTMLQPDIVVLCDMDKFLDKWIEGAPDMVIEVLSQSTRKKDMTLKLRKYLEAGVREYWVIDPKHQTVIVYDLPNDMAVSIYGFRDNIPVRISDGKCSIDFKEIADVLSQFFPEYREADA